VEYYSGYHSNPTHPSLNTDDHLLLPILPNLLQTTSRLNCLTIAGSTLDWNTLDSSLRSAFLHLMHLRTINHIALLLIDNFPLSSLTLSVNLLRLDMTYLSPLQEDGSPEIVVQSDMMPKIRELHISESALLTTKLLHAKRQDGRPAFNFMDLRRLSMSFTRFEDEQNIRYLLQNAGLLEKLHLSIDRGRSLVGLLSPSARTLKVLDLTVFLYDNTFPVSLALAGLCEELEAMAGHNMLEALSLEARVLRSDRTEAFVGSVMQSVEKVLVKPGWSALRQVSFKVAIAYCMQTSVELCEALQSLPDKYLTHLSNLESVAFNFSAFPAHL
jgi:hypothetical protein